MKLSEEILWLPFGLNLFEMNPYFLKKQEEVDHQLTLVTIEGKKFCNDDEDSDLLKVHDMQKIFIVFFFYFFISAHHCSYHFYHFKLS